MALFNDSMPLSWGDLAEESVHSKRAPSAAPVAPPTRTAPTQLEFDMAAETSRDGINLILKNVRRLVGSGGGLRSGLSASRHSRAMKKGRGRFGAPTPRILTPSTHSRSVRCPSHLQSMSMRSDADEQPAAGGKAKSVRRRPSLGYRVAAPRAGVRDFRPRCAAAAALLRAHLSKKNKQLPSGRVSVRWECAKGSVFPGGVQRHHPQAGGVER
jgi:hypothetical protein